VSVACFLAAATIVVIFMRAGEATAQSGPTPKPRVTHAEGADPVVLDWPRLRAAVTYDEGLTRLDPPTAADLRVAKPTEAEARSGGSDQVFLARYTTFGQTGRDGRPRFQGRLVWVERSRNVPAPDLGPPGISDRPVWLADVLNIVDARSGRSLVIIFSAPDAKAMTR
jgi:hypothetical protein